jgi:hypothetical protein
LKHFTEQDFFGELEVCRRAILRGLKETYHEGVNSLRTVSNGVCFGNTDKVS